MHICLSGMSDKILLMNFELYQINRRVENMPVNGGNIGYFGNHKKSNTLQAMHCFMNGGSVWSPINNCSHSDITRTIQLPLTRSDTVS